MPRRKPTNTAPSTSQNIYDILDPNDALGPTERLDSYELPDLYGTPGLYSEHIYPTNPRSTPSRSTKRRWRRRACRDRRLGSYRIYSQSTTGSRTPTQPIADGPGSGTQTPPALSGSVLAAIERVWDLERDTDTVQKSNIDSDTPTSFAVPDSSDPGQVAQHASLMLEVFSHVKPIDDRQLTVVQKSLITTAFTSILVITQQLRVLTVSANRQLDPPPPAANDEALNVYSGCVICYARISDTLLMPCRHLTLCEVCCDEIQQRVQDEARAGPMRCPICRNDVIDQVYFHVSIVNSYHGLRE